MSQQTNEPEDLFDAVCRLDDLAEWLEADYPTEARELRDLSDRLKDFVVLSLPAEGRGEGHGR